MSTTGQDHPSAPGARDPRAMSEDEWRASLPNFGQQLGSGLGHSSSASVASPAAAPSVAPFSTQPRPAGGWRVPPATSNTPWVWWLVFMPLLIVAVVFAVLLVYIYSQGEMYATYSGFLLLVMLPVIAAGIGALQLGISIALSFGDRRRLHALGHQETASPWWNLLSSLAYLIARTVYVRRAAGSGSMPLTVYIAIYLIPGILMGIYSAWYAGFFPLA